MLDLSILPKLKTKMASRVNLDALIEREDFEVLKDGNMNAPLLPAIAISELEQGKFFLNVLRKPDFQRATNEWTPEKVCDFIESFLNDDLIPSIILWNSGNRNFIIDGAHRLSALVAWVLDDYGDGVISGSFFGMDIFPEQRAIAEKTRRLIKKKIGSYADHKFSSINRDKASKEMLERADRMATLTLQLQWVKGNADKAEDSFFKINEEATPINETEKTLLKARKKPNALAARAIINSGTGHKYWSDFDGEKQSEIESLAKEINNLLFKPPYETPMKTLDIPMAGKGYSSETLSLIFDLINVSNYIEKKKGQKKELVFYRKTNEADLEIKNDPNGDSTIFILKSTRKLLYRISDTHPSSLGLHPVVYFYSSTGRYQVTSFIAMIEMIKYLEKKNLFRDFIKIRERFESFLMKYKIFVNQTTVKYGSGLKGYKQLEKLYLYIMELLRESATDEEIINSLAINEEYVYLNPNETELENDNRKEFSTGTKSAIFLKRALETPIKCEICHGLMHRNATHFDHKDRKSDGGMGVIGNGQLAHPYCNTTVKN